MDDQRPKVSIGIPVYNGEEFLAAALDSLLAQTFTDFELIISDNASTDGTEEICRSYAARDKRVRYHRSERNLGAAWNFNRTVELATGEYFKWAAHDDVCAPTFLERCVEVLDQNPQVTWCHTLSTHIDAAGNRLSDPAHHEVGYAGEALKRSSAIRGYRGRESRTSAHAHERFAAVLLGPGGCIDVFGLIRATALRQTALHLPYYGADKVVVAELSLRGAYCEVPQVLFSVRVHSEASGSIRTATAQRQFINPLGSRRFAFTRLNLLRGHTAAVLRAPLGWRDRCRCLAVLGRYLMQMRKWGGVFTKFVSGVGTGGGYLSTLPPEPEADEKPVVELPPSGMRAVARGPISELIDS